MPVPDTELGEFGTAKFYIQMAMLTGVLAPFIALALVMYFQPKDPPQKQ